MARAVTHRLSTTVRPRIVHLSGGWRTCAVAMEAWSDGVLNARIVGCSVYGEGETEEAAAESLEESLTAFVESVQKETAPLSGQVAKDWQLLQALFNVCR